MILATVQLATRLLFIEEIEMQTSFEIVASDFARKVLGNQLTGDPVRDAIKSLTMNHALTGKTSSCRLNKWAIFRKSGCTLATDIASYPGGDDRTVWEAFSAELAAMKEPVVLVIFSKALITVDTLKATYDPRKAAICHPDGVKIFDVTDPETKHPLARAYRTEMQKDAA